MSTEEKIHSGIYYVIPAQVFEDSRLEHSEIMFYALISGLSFSSGYCFASDVYLAEKMRVDVRTVQRWLNKFEEYKYLKRETKKRGMGWERKIFVNHSRSNLKSSYEQTPTSVTNRRPCPLRTDAHVDIVGKELESKEKEVVCTSDDPKPEKIPSRVVKKHPEGHEIEISFEKLVQEACLKGKSWTPKEIRSAWIILVAYQGQVRDFLGFIEGTIKKRRNQSKGEAYSANKREEKWNQKYEKDISEKCKKTSSEHVTAGSLFPEFAEPRKI